MLELAPCSYAYCVIRITDHITAGTTRSTTTTRTRPPKLAIRGGYNVWSSTGQRLKELIERWTIVENRSTCTCFPRVAAIDLASFASHLISMSSVYCSSYVSLCFRRASTANGMSKYPDGAIPGKYRESMLYSCAGMPCYSLISVTIGVAICLCYEHGRSAAELLAATPGRGFPQAAQAFNACILSSKYLAAWSSASLTSPLSLMIVAILAVISICFCTSCTAA